MARPRYSAAKRAREIRKQEKRAKKLARKHGRSTESQGPQEPEITGATVPGPEGSLPGPEGSVPGPEDAPST
jgi:hypothetical protein